MVRELSQMHKDTSSARSSRCSSSDSIQLFINKKV